VFFLLGLILGCRFGGCLVCGLILGALRGNPLRFSGGSVGVKFFPSGSRVIPLALRFRLFLFRNVLELVCHVCCRRACGGAGVGQEGTKYSVLCQRRAAGVLRGQVRTIR